MRHALTVVTNLADQIYPLPKHALWGCIASSVRIDVWAMQSILELPFPCETLDDPKGFTPYETKHTESRLLHPSPMLGAFHWQ